ncbi:MIP/aquaporin family protein [Streptomyces sp. GC420]|uniref:MIP/aquaporin family protein n=1 Tax=Streptomyces sp. GC420 TaxID=2697568 RepID=UPI001414D7C8|nr:aquaporin [Streptomyces sp. GC420]NBM18558.1 aquaporin family protein [Streptomyces sp. GC420]
MEENTHPQKLLAEMLGTAMLVFIGVGSVPATLIVGGEAPFTMAELGMISLAFATVVIAMVYAIGHISGCQINPAVTVALAATGKTPWRDVPGYIAAQIAGALLGALAIVGVLGKKAVTAGLGIAAYGADVTAGQALLAEAVGTFILAFVVFGAIDERSSGGFAGLAIGLAVFAVIIPVAPATGAAINPARTVGPMVVGELSGSTVQWEQLPVYLIAQVAGAVAAGFLYLTLGARRQTAATTEAPAEPAAAEGVLQ